MIRTKYQAKVQGVIEDIADAAEYIHSDMTAVAGVKYFINVLSITNMHATQATRVNIKDGAGGAVIWAGPAAALGGGAMILFPDDQPLEFSSGSAVVVQCETAGALVTVAMRGYKRAQED